MKLTIEYDDNEIESLDDEIKEQLEDGKIKIEPTPDNAQTFLNIAGAEDVHGLRAALKTEREARKKAERDLKSTSARLTLADGEEKDAEIAQLKASLEQRDGEVASLKKQAVEKDHAAKITAAVSKHRGDVELLMPHLKTTLAENPNADLDAVLTDFKEKHPSAFAASSQSGGGSQPGGSDPRPAMRPAHVTKRRSEMTDREKIDAQRELGLDGFMALPE